MTSIEVSTLSRLVGRLVRMGLVTRSRSEKSSREVVVELSGKGRALVERLIPIAKELEQTASADMPAKDMAVVKRALRRMYENLGGQVRRRKPMAPHCVADQRCAAPP